MEEEFSLTNWERSTLPIPVITDCESLFNCLAKDASVPEDRVTALTVASLRERCSAGLGRDQKNDEESTNVLRRKHFTGSSQEVRDVSVVQMDLEQGDWWQ